MRSGSAGGELKGSSGSASAVARAARRAGGSGETLFRAAAVADAAAAGRVVALKRTSLAYAPEQRTLTACARLTARFMPSIVNVNVMSVTENDAAVSTMEFLQSAPVASHKQAPTARYGLSFQAQGMRHCNYVVMYTLL